MQSTFDLAVQAVIYGDLTTLSSLLNSYPQLTTARSNSNHNATLLHYISANGVEDELQRTPFNIVEVAELLLEKGAEVDAESFAYGGGMHATTLNFLLSSYGPYEKGVQEDLVQCLIRYGAKIEGLGNNGSPLGTALGFGYRRSAEILVELGASYDNVLYAAGLGKLEFLKSCFEENGELKSEYANFYRHPEWPEMGRYSWPPPKGKDPLKIAFIYACLHGRNEVIQFFLDKGMDANTSVSFNQNGVHFASQIGYMDTVKLLVENGANPAQIESQMNQTPIQWAEEGGESKIAEYLKSKLG